MSQTSIKVYSEMGLLKLPLLVLLFSVFSLLSFTALCDDSELTVKFLKTPYAFSNLNSTVFVFEVLVGGSSACTNCNVTCKLDDGLGRIIASECENGTVLCEGLQDGNHKFEVCPNGSQGVGCDTVPPTANITASTNFTNALNVSINISFSEPCTGGGSSVCSSTNDCNLLVYGDGNVIPTSLKILQPNLQYSVLVNLSSTAQSGRVILVMDKNFCTDSAGNKFERNKNSNFTLRFDRRSMVVNLTTHVPERQLDFNGETRLVRATNNCVKLRICITFPVPVLNSSAEILNSLEPKILYSLPMSKGKLLPLNVSKDDPGHRRFEFMVDGCISGMAIVTIGIDENSIISKHGTPVSKVDNITFLFDSLRPAPMLITPPSDSLMPDIRLSIPPSDSLGPDVNLTTLLHMRTREHNISMWVEFMEPVFDFNGSEILIKGGELVSFVPESERRKYAVVIRAFDDHDIVSVNVPENVAHDAAGNKNLASETLLVKKIYTDSVPIISIVISTLATASFVATSIAAGLLTASTASLSSIGTFSPPFSSVSDPASNLFRMAGHIQVFALSRWLGVPLPVEYYEFSRGMQWSIPYFRLPWETGRTHSSDLADSHPFRSKIHDSGFFPGVHHNAKAIPKSMQLKADDYIKLLKNSGPDPVSDGWEDFSRTMFWLAIIGGSLILLHALLLAILKFRKQRQRGYGVLAFPRFEIFLVNLAVPSICEASAALIRGGTTSGIVVGTLILVAVSFLLLDLLWFLSTGITFAKRVLYKEDNQVIQVGRGNPRIAQVTLGPGNEGRWTLNRKQNSDCLTILVPLFEDLRGPILSITAPDDEAGEGSGGTDLAPPSSAQSMSRSTRPSHIPPTRSSTVATPAVPLMSSTSAHTHGAYQIIAPDDKTEEVEVSRGSVPTHAEASSIQNLFMQLRIYYTLIESVRRVLLGAMGGAYKNTWSSTIPVIILLCITSLQLFFLVLEKPFIKRRVQLVETISVASEVCLFALSLVLVDKKLSPKQETIVGVSMLVIFLMGFLPQIVNELYALRRQIKHLDTAEKRFRTGLRIASFGILLFFISQDSLEKTDCFGDNEPNDIGGQGGEESTNDTGGQGGEKSTNDTGGQGDEDTNATKRNRNSGRRNKNPKNRNRNSETTVNG
ncbi:uncharacterized protein LOC142632960 [Castanea sativa]|uniref:uncharacterized protein LOC142632960 n=1 Tax=Castanea sativa TaxID=21020 RepID=UPI003F652CBC